MLVIKSNTAVYAPKGQKDIRAGMVTANTQNTENHQSFNA